MEAYELRKKIIFETSFAYNVYSIKLKLIMKSFLMWLCIWGIIHKKIHYQRKPID
jgi:hypothetical protein